MIIILIVLIAYLIGSIPTAYIMGKLVKKIDIRNFGSGNVGATNVFRTLGAKWGIITLLLDMLKGFIPVLLVKILFDDNFNFQLACGLAAVIGHIFTLFLKFKGGKGVATAAGFLIAFTPVETGFTLIVFIIVFITIKIVSAGSIIAAASYPVFIIIFNFSNRALLIFSVLLALLIILKHKSNIKRIIKGEEKKLADFKLFGKK